MKSPNQEAFKTKMRTIFYNLDIKNNICADCGKQKSMDYASINNGIIICENCAKEHQNLGYNISFLHSLSEKWDDYLFNFIKLGGNSRFLQFCKDYKLDKNNNNKSITQKYKSKGLTYYREILRSEVLGYDPPENINVNKAFEEEKNIPDNYPEFKKYSFVKHVDMNYLEKNFYVKKEEKKDDDSFFGKIGGFFGNVSKNIGFDNLKEMGNNLGNNIVKKVQEFDFQEVKQKGADVFGYCFFGGGNSKDNNKDSKEENKDDIINENINAVKDSEDNKNAQKENEENVKDNNINNIKKIEINEDLKSKIKNNLNKIKEDKEKEKDNFISKEENRISNYNENKTEKNIKEIKNEINEIKKDDKENNNNNSENKIIINIQKEKENKENESDNNIIINDENVILDTNNYELNLNQINEEENNEQEENKEKIDINSKETIGNDNAIEEILKDNNFNNDNTKMNNEEKDELEKMLQD